MNDDDILRSVFYGTPGPSPAPQPSEPPPEAPSIAERLSPEPSFAEARDAIFGPSGQTRQLQQRREELKDWTGTNVGEEIKQKSIPFVGSWNNYIDRRELGKAYERYNAGEANGSDINLIARHQRQQEVEQSEGTGRAFARAATGIPALVGEFSTGVGIAGRAGSAIGLAPKAGATLMGSKTAATVAGRAAAGVAATPFAPSTYAEGFAQNQVEHPDESVFQQLAPALALAASQNAVLGQLQGMFSAAPITRAGRIGAKTAVGLAESEAASAATTNLDRVAKDVTGQTLGLDTKYGTLGSLIRREEGSAKQAIVQALTFSVFSAMHSGKAPSLSALTDHLNAARGRGLSADAALKPVAEAGQRLADALKTNPNLTQEEGRKLFENDPPGSARDAAFELANTLKPAKVDETSQPTAPKTDKVTPTAGETLTEPIRNIANATEASDPLESLSVAELKSALTRFGNNVRTTDPAKLLALVRSKASSKAWAESLAREKAAESVPEPAEPKPDTEPVREAERPADANQERPAAVSGERPTEPAAPEADEPVRDVKAAGRDTTVVVPGGQPIPAKYELRELSDVRASHEVLQSGGMRSRAKAGEYPDSLQPRDYDNAPGEQMKVLEGSNKLEPRYLVSEHPDATNGPPTITRDGNVVINGNGRQMMMEGSRFRGTYDRYREYLAANAEKFGLDPAEIARMKEPALYRVVDLDPNGAEASAFARAGNVTTTQAQSPERTAAAHRELITDDILKRLRLEGDETFSQAVVSKEGESFRQALRDRLPPSVRDAYFDGEGQLTEAGKELVQNMMLTKILPVDLIEALGRDRKQLLNNVEAAIPQLLKLRGNNAHAFNVTPEIVEALEYLGRNPEAKDATYIQNSLDQLDIFSGQRSESLSPGGRMMLDFLMQRQGSRQFRSKLVQVLNGERATGGLLDLISEPRSFDPVENVAQLLGVKLRPGATFGALKEVQNAIQDLKSELVPKAAIREILAEVAGENPQAPAGPEPKRSIRNVANTGKVIPAEPGFVATDEQVAVRRKPQQAEPEPPPEPPPDSAPEMENIALGKLEAAIARLDQARVAAREPVLSVRKAARHPDVIAAYGQEPSKSAVDYARKRAAAKGAEVNEADLERERLIRAARQREQPKTILDRLAENEEGKLNLAQVVEAGLKAVVVTKRAVAGRQSQGDPKTFALDPDTSANTPRSLLDHDTLTDMYQSQQGHRGSNDAQIALGTWQYSEHVADQFAKDWRRGQASDPFSKDPAMADTITDAMNDPAKFRALTPEQQQFVKDVWIPTHDKMLEDAYAAGKSFKDKDGKEIPLDEMKKKGYFPQTVVPETDFMAAVKGLFKPGRKQSFRYEREYDREEDGVAAGVKYVPSALDRIQDFIHGMYREIIAERVANDPRLGGVSEIPATRKRLFAENKPFLDALPTKQMKEQFTGELLQRARAEATGNVRDIPAFRDKTYPEESKAEIEKMFAGGSRGLKLVAAIGQEIRNIVLGGDFSYMFLQLRPMIFTNLPRFLRTIKNIPQSLFNPELFAQRQRTDPKFRQVASEYIQSGGTLGSMPEQTSSLGTGRSLVDKVPGVRTVYRSLNRTFGTIVDFAKLELFEANRPADPAEWPRAVENLENSLGSGRMEQLGLTPARSFGERLVFLAPAYYRGYLQLIPQALQRGAPGFIARKQLGSLAAGSLLLGLAALLLKRASGELSEEEFDERINPERGKFMAVPVEVGSTGKKVEVGMGGFYLSIVRLLGNSKRYAEGQSGENPIMRWYEGHAGAIPRLEHEIRTGRDFQGRDTTADKTAIRSLAPVAAQPALENLADRMLRRDRDPQNAESNAQTGAIAALTLFGLNAFASSEKGAWLDDLRKGAKEKYDRKWEDLPFMQQKAIVKAQGPAPKTESANARVRGAEAAQQRQEHLANMVNADTRSRLKELGHKLPGYHTDLSIDGVEIPLTRDRLERYGQLLAEEYDKDVAKWPVGGLRIMQPAAREKSIAARLEKAKEKAKDRLIREYR